MRAAVSCVSLLLIGYASAFSQLVTVPITHSYSGPGSAHKNTASRTKGLTSMLLPFWDDFSFTRTAYPHDTLWSDYKSVWVNNGMGINPPSINVATFDGLNFAGRPYNVNNDLAKGLADTLTSRPLRMDLIDPSFRLGVLLSFFYQFQGNGEAPDSGDSFSLYFKNSSGVWDLIWSVENNGTLQKDVFVPVSIAVSDPKYFHDAFQFQFRNFARLSGPYDTWNLDYVFLSNGKTSSDPPPFPDRAVASTLTSLFPGYHAVPLKHFFTDPAAHLTNPTVILTNRRQDQLQGSGQPVNYSTSIRIATKKNDVVTTVTVPLDNKAKINTDLYYNEKKVVPLATLPAAALFDPLADSIGLDLKFVLNSGDNVVKTDTGDYVPAIYSPVNFRLNDSTRRQFTLQDYYAYDDGVAEYGAGLNQPGAQLAYKFDMKTPEQDTLVGINMYFPRFGDDTSQTILLSVWRDLNNTAGSLLYQRTVTIVRSEQNKFSSRYILLNSIPVKGTFYIGWKQTTATVIAVGLDKNTDSGDNMYYNLNGMWQKNINLRGSLMMRPVFGSNNEVITGLGEHEIESPAYPNPSNGIFYLSKDVSNVMLYDLAGRSVDVYTETFGDAQKIEMHHVASGIYILHYIQNNKLKVQKIMVRP